jgi:hypothetical protein
MVNMLSSCLKSIAENTHLAMTTKQQTELQKAELANVKATMGEMQEKMEGIMHENATLRAQATGGTPPPDPGVAALKQRLLEVESRQDHHGAQIAQALEQIYSEMAAEEVVLAHFGDAADEGAAPHHDDEAPKTKEEQEELYKNLIKRSSMVSTRQLSVALEECSDDFGGLRTIRLAIRPPFRRACSLESAKVSCARCRPVHDRHFPGMEGGCDHRLPQG